MPTLNRAIEFSIGNRRVAVKTARAQTSSVGVTYLVLERVDDVYGCWEVAPEEFDVWSLPTDVFKSAMRETASKGPSAGRVGLVTRTVFESRGKAIHPWRWDIPDRCKGHGSTLCSGKIARCWKHSDIHPLLGRFSLPATE